MRRRTICEERRNLMSSPTVPFPKKSRDVSKSLHAQTLGLVLIESLLMAALLAEEDAQL
jgi:hypothetical protein